MLTFLDYGNLGFQLLLFILAINTCRKAAPWRDPNPVVLSNFLLVSIDTIHLFVFNIHDYLARILEYESFGVFGVRVFLWWYDARYYLQHFIFILLPILHLFAIESLQDESVEEEAKESKRSQASYSPREMTIGSVPLQPNGRKQASRLKITLDIRLAVAFFYIALAYSLFTVYFLSIGILPADAIAYLNLLVFNLELSKCTVYVLIVTLK
ncbi:unnamed protein product, partial [Mesorhabditis spiculigera]